MSIQIVPPVKVFMVSVPFMLGFPTREEREMLIVGLDGDVDILKSLIRDRYATRSFGVGQGPGTLTWLLSDEAEGVKGPEWTLQERMTWM